MGNIGDETQRQRQVLDQSRSEREQEEAGGRL